jgi:hypothetical protein
MPTEPISRQRALASFSQLWSPRIVTRVLARPAAHSKLLLEPIRHRLTDLSVKHPIAGVRVMVDEACPDPGAAVHAG